jgi:hypothetical protein
MIENQSCYCKNRKNILCGLARPSEIFINISCVSEGVADAEIDARAYDVISIVITVIPDGIFINH